MKKLFYLSLIILFAASSCTVNLYTTGGYDDVYYSPDEISGTVLTSESSVDQDKATYEETFNANSMKIIIHLIIIIMMIMANIMMTTDT